MDAAKKKKFVTIAAVVGLTTVAAAGVVVAFLTRQVESRANQFTFVSADIELTEPAWDPTETHVVTPKSEEPKNPQVQNTGDAPLYIFLEVRVPYAATAQVVETGGTPPTQSVTEATDVDLLTFTVNGKGTSYTDADGQPKTYDENTGYWVPVSEPEDKKSYGKMYHSSFYAFTKPVPPRTGVTIPLFDSVTYPWYIVEGYPTLEATDGSTLPSSKDIDMPIYAYAVQADNLQEISGDQAKIEDELKEVYNHYIANGHHTDGLRYDDSSSDAGTP